MARFRISQSDDWDLEHEEQDIRGWDVIDATGDVIGTVDDLIADTETERVEAIRLDDGREFPARDIQISEGVVYLDESVIEDDGTVAVEVYSPSRVRRL